MLLGTEEKTKVVKWYWETRSIIATKRKFRTHFKTKRAPCAKSILRLQEKILAHGSVLNQHKGKSGRKRSKRTEHDILKVKNVISTTPSKSIRKLAQEVGTSHTTVRQILREDLKLTPYKITTHQKLYDGDQEQRLAFSNWLKEKTDSDPAFLKRIIFSDEAHFHLNGTVNSQNSRLWASSRPDTVQESPMHSPKVTCWCAVTAGGLIGPFFFENSNGATVTINKERYVGVLERLWRTLVADPDVFTENIWFQQDGAPPHTSRLALSWLEEHFGGRVISQKTEIPWPAHSPDLTPLDFYLWGFMKTQVYAMNPESLPDLKKAIRKVARAITPQTCAKAIAEVGRRTELCILRDGGHLEHVL